MRRIWIMLSSAVFGLWTASALVAQGVVVTAVVSIFTVLYMSILYHIAKDESQSLRRRQIALSVGMVIGISMGVGMIYSFDNYEMVRILETVASEPCRGGEEAKCV